MTVDKEAILKKHDLIENATFQHKKNLIAAMDEYLEQGAASLRKERDELKEVLRQCDDYFDNYADADYIQEKYAPNPEMQLLAQIRRLI